MNTTKRTTKRERMLHHNSLHDIDWKVERKHERWKYQKKP